MNRRPDRRPKSVNRGRPARGIVSRRQSRQVLDERDRMVEKSASRDGNLRLDLSWGTLALPSTGGERAPAARPFDAPEKPRDLVQWPLSGRQPDALGPLLTERGQPLDRQGKMG